MRRVCFPTLVPAAPQPRSQGTIAVQLHRFIRYFSFYVDEKKAAIGCPLPLCVLAPMLP